MIRIEITKTQWRTPAGNLAFFEPVPEEGVEHTKERQVLLVQEFDDLRIEPIVALLNRLQETPLCMCGHPKHEGPCQVVVSPNNLMYGNEQTCDCERYRTAEQALLEGMEKKAAKLDAEVKVTLAESNADLKRAVERQSELLDEVNRLTRSRDRLLSKGRKARA